MQNQLMAKRAEQSQAIRKVVANKRKIEDPARRQAELLESGMEYAEKQLKALEDESNAMRIKLERLQQMPNYRENLDQENAQLNEKIHEMRVDKNKMEL